jgi:hypothetical protein
MLEIKSRKYVKRRAAWEKVAGTGVVEGPQKPIERFINKRALSSNRAQINHHEQK